MEYFVNPSNTAKVSLETFQRSGIGPSEFVAVNISTLQCADEEYRYFLLIIDVFTRCIEAVPLKYQKASSLVSEFKKGGFSEGMECRVSCLAIRARIVDWPKSE